ncbi:MAG TPA: glycosyltransferase family 39 protein [Thermoanaerobaculia bacterium]|nr:glycosyltransferase family 39 protein [Thermoanaerobaculia bacterium]
MSAAGGSRLERWLAPRASALAALLIALGAAARVAAARGTFLTPDEKLHLQIAGVANAAGVYRTSLDNAHPPLFVLLLHFWMKVVRSDWALRLLPVACGALFLVAVWVWARRLLGDNAGLLALVLLALMPSVVLVSSELRGYALLLSMIAAALAALEKGLDEKSAVWTAAFGVFGALALLSHYAAFRFAAAAVVYSAARLAAGPRDRRLVAAWAGACALLAAVAGALLVTHVARLRGGPLEAEASTTWLRESYFHAGEPGGPLAFLGRQTLSLFHYLYSSTPTGLVALGLYAAAIVFLARGRAPVAVLLALPLLLAAAGGLLAVYPYGGTRHGIDLAVFVSAGAALGLSRVTGERRWVVLAAAVALAPAAFLVAG